MRHRGIRTGSFVLAGVMLPLLLAGPAPSQRTAASPWRAASVIPGTVGNIYGLQVALADNGDAVAIWVDVDGSASVIKSAIRPAGGSWGRPRSLSRSQVFAGAPDLAVDRKGNAVAVSRASLGSADTAQVAVRPARGSFGAPHTLAEADQSVVGSFGPPRVAVGPTGNAVVVWAGGKYGDPLVQFADGTARRGFGAPHTLAHGWAPDVAIDAAGGVTVAWNGARGGVEAAFRPRRGRFAAPRALGGGADPVVGGNARGDVVVAWKSASYPQNVLAAFRRAGSAFGSAQTVGPAGDFAHGLQAAVDPRGTALVVWGLDQYDRFPLQAAIRPPRGPFAAPKTLSPDIDTFDLDMGSRGNAVVVWSRYAGDFVVQAATWQRTRGFSAARDLSQHGLNAKDAAVALNGNGRGLAVWRRSRGRDFVLQARTYGAAPVGRDATGSGGSGPAWLPPSVVSSAAAHNERVAIDAQGRVTAAWVTRDGTDQGVVQAVTRMPGGTFGAPVDISTGGVWAGPDVGVDAAGKATVVWASGSPSRVVVRAAACPAAGSFGPAEALAAPATYVYFPRIVVNQRGDALASWAASPDGSTFSVEAAFRPAGGSFGAPEQVSSAETAPPIPNVALDEYGNAVAVWTVYRGGPSVVQAAFRAAGGSFDAPQTLAEEPGQIPGGAYRYVADPDVAIDADGNATALWTNSRTIEASSRPAATGVWERPQTISDQQGGSSPRVAVDTAGRAIAAWVANMEVGVKTATRTRVGEDWGSPETLSGAGERTLATAPAIAVGTTDVVVVAWITMTVIEAAIRNPEGTFAPARDVSQAGVQLGGPPSVGVDPQGDAISVWRVVRTPLPRYSHNGYVEASAYDATAPELSDLRIPATGKAGPKLRFSVAPVDAWSGIASVRWHFGDRSKATGRAATHAYGRAGRYRVTLTATDGAGNTTTSAGTVHIVKG